MMRSIPLLALAVLLAACGEADTRLYGYAEGKFVLLAPETTGRLVNVRAVEGAHVEAGIMMFQLDDSTERAALESARNTAAAAAARFDDAAAGGREPEVAAARELLTQARAAQVRAQADRDRAQSLFQSGVVARARLDEAAAAADAADARVAELRQRLSLTALPARENALRAVDAEAKAAQAHAIVADDNLRRRYVTSPAAGRVERVIRHTGDLAGPDKPAVRFLPDGQVRAIVFIPAPRLAQTPVGTRLAVRCDGCPEGARAEITSVAEESEFTPPIIYSDNERARLVFRAEARFLGFTPPPGTPLDLEPLR
jgi:HlyD family secretion protein